MNLLNYLKNKKSQLLEEKQLALKSDEQKNIEIVIENNTNLFENEL